MLKITEKQTQFLLRYLPELRESVENGEMEVVMRALDAKLNAVGFNDDYSLNKTGVILQTLYDALYKQNVTPLSRT